MAHLSNFNIFVALALLSSFFVQGTLGGMTCEQLNKEECAFAVSATGKRCVLEKFVRRSGEEAYKCTTSEIEADKMKDLVETNHCIEACGLDRDTLGISSDSLLESRFTQKLCSPQCYKNCPNVVDLYFNLAAGEGVFLPKLCKSQATNPRRGMAEIKSSAIAAPGPVSGLDTSAQFMGAPVESPFNSVNFMDNAPAMAPVDFSDPPASSPYPFNPVNFMDNAPAMAPVDFSDPPALSPYPFNPVNFMDNAPAMAPVDFSDPPALSPYPFNPVNFMDNAPAMAPVDFSYPPASSPYPFNPVNFMDNAPAMAPVDITDAPAMSPVDFSDPPAAMPPTEA